MTAMPPLRDILNNTPADAINVDFNFNTIEAHIGQELINRDGSVAMTAPLSTQPPTVSQHAATKAYVDAILPVGMIVEFGGLSAPGGWALCDGSSQSRTDPIYQALFAVIGTNYGSVDGAHFNLPNMKGRFPVGKGGDGTGGTVNTPALNAPGGNKDAAVISHTHDIAHTHGGVTMADAGGHEHSWGGSTSAQSPATHRHGIPAGRYVLSQLPGGGSQGGASIVGSQSPGSSQDPFTDDGAHTHSVGGSTTGGGGHSHTTNSIPLGSTQSLNPAGSVAGTDKNLPPYVVVNYIIRIG